MTRYLLVLLLLIAACQKPERTVSTAFYHWQTRLALTEPEEQYLQKINARALYIKFFDVDWDENRQQAVPLAILQVADSLPDSLAVIPTVFITNRTFSQLDGDRIDTLAQRIHDKIFELAENFTNQPLPEIQVDCDWSQTTREKYFRLLRYLRAQLQPRDMLLSATIRLHQIHYRETTGVPPVDRGALMCYNTGEVTDWSEENSILRLETAGPYFDRLSSYPFDLDLALPIFAWGVLFRDGRMIRLINDLRPADLSDSTCFSLLYDNRYEVIKSTFLRGYYLYRGDRLRLERTNAATLRDVTAQLSERWQTQQLRLIFYHLDSTTTADYQWRQLNDLREMMR